MPPIFGVKSDVLERSKSSLCFTPFPLRLNMNSLPIEIPPSKGSLVVDWTSRIRQRGKASLLATEIAMIAGGVLLLSMLAQLKINIGIVPITGQSFGILLVGAALGWDRGLVCVASYLVAGLCGAPVFAATIGPAAFVAPTGGFLFSFLPAVALVGYLSDRGWDRKFSTAVWSFLFGHAIIFAIGVAWLAVWLQDLPLAVTNGFLPFLPGMVVKTLVATALLPMAWQLRERNRN